MRRITLPSLLCCILQTSAALIATAVVIVSAMLAAGAMPTAIAAAGPSRANDSDTEWVYIGTHGAGKSDPPGAASEGQGIYAVHFNPRTGQLSEPQLQLSLPRATWLSRHPRLPILYATTDAGPPSTDDSNILPLRVDPASGKLTPLDPVDSGGRDATHLAFDAASNTLLVANYGNGTVTALPVRPDGRLAAVVSSQIQNGTGPHPRQTMPHPHGVAVDSEHHHVLVSDFGADRIFVYHFDRAARALEPAAVSYETLPPGSGPRHLLFGKDARFLYLLTELTARLHVYRWDWRAARLQPIQTLSTYPTDYSAPQRSAAELALAADGRFLYVCLRGDQNSIVVYEIAHETGTLHEIQRMAAGGKTPWDLAIDPTGRWLFTTHEASNTVGLFNIDPASGHLTATAATLSIPRPVAVTFYTSARDQSPHPVK